MSRELHDFSLMIDEQFDNNVGHANGFWDSLLSFFA